MVSEAVAPTTPPEEELHDPQARMGASHWSSHSGDRRLFAAACGDDETHTSSDDSTTHDRRRRTSDAPSDADIEALTASIAGGGASFPDSFYQAVNTDFNDDRRAASW